MEHAGKYYIHVKNNRWAAGSFPNTPEGEEVFTIDAERFGAALADFPDLADRIEPFFDWDEDNFRSSVARADILLTWNLPTDGLAGRAPHLRWIHCIGAGVEHLLPLDWLPANVELTNNKGVHSDKAGEYGLMAALMLHNHVPAIVTNQRNEVYDSLYSTPIAGRTVVVVGTGSLGGAVISKLAPLGPNLVGVNRRGGDVEGCARVVPTGEIDAVLPHADILYLAMPDTPETNGLIDRRRLDMLKPTCGVVNIGRQSAMDYDALCDKLEAGELAGAVLDVFTPEPIEKGSRLWSTPNLIVTPHVSADDGDRYVPLTLDLFFRNLQRFVDGTELLNRVDREFGY
ncbi:MAG: D-2-hydroxyacid dehydrogenase [Gammaproteobacteria bacterium]|nr:D-2-hydroxyacid dehydrogenase [Gammaproteobacteria bacterium]MXX16242.1 D-2-hydroxyacid dehydrogenase [Gammaproteobacteria bacterium]MXY65817.1 D-2-hydroxyacid dehydrogenase [Gammaproteobacteria bacterium]MYG65325.1 D-2-hydroxyacid dehydrogenase [Gammaproteobacteria bacterium]MYH89629.1 D-2-hydroxyacid dehydrogenase [Gammaproteobacteria bacterium]